MSKILNICQRVLIFITICVLNGCTFPWVNLDDKSIQDQAVDEIYQVAKSDQREYLRELTNLEDITEYIDNFWKQHDPTPDTPENEFLQIYYSRLQYANDHFKEILFPGSRTERGRIYVLYGPPDEIFEEPMFMDYMTNNVYESINVLGDIKSVVVWRYFKPASKPFTIEFTGLDYAYMYFWFVDLDGFGTYELVATNVKEEPVSARLK